MIDAQNATTSGLHWYSPDLSDRLGFKLMWRNVFAWSFAWHTKRKTFTGYFVYMNADSRNEMKDFQL